MKPPNSVNLRIVLLGMTGAGKSATGNTILGREEFEEDFNPESVTRQSKRKETRKGNRSILIIDTPGLQDTVDKAKVGAEIKKCMEMSAPGPHVFLLVIRLDEKYTEEGMNTVKWIQKNFGEKAAGHTIILFTHADALKGKPLKDHIEESQDLQQFVMTCGGRYHGFNNEDRENQSQVKELLDKMDELVIRNKGRHYTNERFNEEQGGSNWFETGIAIGVLCVIGVVAVVFKRQRVK